MFTGRRKKSPFRRVALCAALIILMLMVITPLKKAGEAQAQVDYQRETAESETVVARHWATVNAHATKDAHRSATDAVILQTYWPTSTPTAQAQSAMPGLHESPPPPTRVLLPEVAALLTREPLMALFVFSGRESQDHTVYVATATPLFEHGHQQVLATAASTSVPDDPEITKTPYLAIDDEHFRADDDDRPRVDNVVPVWLLPAIAGNIQGPIIGSTIIVAGSRLGHHLWRTATTVGGIIVGAFINSNLKTHIVERGEVSSWCYGQLECQTVYAGQAHLGDGDLHCVQNLQSNPKWAQCNQQFYNQLLHEQGLTGNNQGGGGNGGGSGGGGSSNPQEERQRQEREQQERQRQENLRDRSLRECFPPGARRASDNIRSMERLRMNTHNLKETFRVTYGEPCKCHGVCVH